MGKAVSTLQAEGHETFKSESCFADLSAKRTGNKTHYDPDYFHREGATAFPVLFDNDVLDGATCESLANNLLVMVNIRRNEAGDGGTIPGFPRKEFVFSSASCFFLDLLFCRFDELWTAARPGIVYIVPTRFSIVVGFHTNHRDQYKKKRNLQPNETMKRKKHNAEKERKPYTIKDPTQYSKYRLNNRSATKSTQPDVVIMSIIST